METRPGGQSIQAPAQSVNRPVGSTGASSSAYDVVVIGAGIGGLTAGALLARAGKKVLVVEAEAQPGGFARALRRGAYTFDRADHLVMGCAPESPFGPGVIDAVLRHLGVGDRCAFITMDDPFYVARFPDFALSVPRGRQAYLEAHLRRPDQVPARYLRRLRRLELSHSYLAQYAATDLDVRALGAQHDTSLYTDWDHERVYAKGLAGEVTLLSILIPTLKDPSLAPPGEHLVILKAIAPAGEAPDGDKHADRMLELAEQVLPDLRQHLTFVDEGAAGTRFGPRLHLLGPYSGWTASPRQTGTRRLPQETPVAGLLLAGQWTRPGHGIWTVMVSGIGAARFALGAPTSTPALPLYM